jgi:hypothetical protein
MTKNDKIAIRDLKLKSDGDSGDYKRAFWVGNDYNLTIEVNTDDCDRTMAKAAFRRVAVIVNLCAGLEVDELRAMLAANDKL